MTDLVRSPCVGCRFAEWERTANGKLHPDQSGRCTWRPKIEPMPWWTASEKLQLAQLGDYRIDRCDVYSYDIDATCDAREEA